jgi:hypothetical protein
VGGERGEGHLREAAAEAEEEGMASINGAGGGGRWGQEGWRENGGRREFGGGDLLHLTNGPRYCSYETTLANRPCCLGRDQSHLLQESLLTTLPETYLCRLGLLHQH